MLTRIRAWKCLGNEKGEEDEPYIPTVRAMQTEGRKKGVSKNSENRGARVVPCEALTISPPVSLPLPTRSNSLSFFHLSRAPSAREADPN